jgi:hypothetical protein
MRITGDQCRKTLVPAVTADYVPAIYARAISGDSLQKIADWLTSEGVKTERGHAVWNEGTVNQGQWAFFRASSSGISARSRNPII